MGIPSQHEYEQREIRAAQAQRAAVQRAPLRDRKEAQLAFFEAMRDDPALVAERLGWLLDGNYGYGAMMLAQTVLRQPRMNRQAALTQMIGVYEWQCPEDMTRAAWKRLSPGEAAALGREVRVAISDAEEALDEAAPQLAGGNWPAPSPAWAGSGYWKGHPAYVSHERLARVDNNMGRWEIYKVKYRTTPDYEGGTQIEIYREGQLEHGESFEPALHNQKGEHLIQDWIEMEYGQDNED